MIVVISSPTPVHDELNVICKLFDSGLELLHLRKKGLDENQLKVFIERIPVEYHAKIVLHSHYYLAAEYQLKGIHVPFNFKGTVNDYSISVSFHSVLEISEFTFPYNYGFLSPIFDSISKKGYKGWFDKGELKQFLKLQSNKILALGGIDEDKIEIVKDLGFSGAALLGAIWQSGQPVANFKQMNALWQK